MLNNNYLSVMVFQLKLNIKCTSNQDILVKDDAYYKQMEASLELIKKYDPDIVVYPEMSFDTKYDNFFREMSTKDKLIVFGSTYLGNYNTTMVFTNGILVGTIKSFACGSEPMVRYLPKISPEQFIKFDLSKHEFYVKGQKVYVLNCLEYYEAAYMIARDEKLSSNLFAFIAPCSNSNPKVFIEESKAVHNHNEYIYSFVANRVRADETNRYGRSYIFGPIQYHEKDWLKEEGIVSEDHNASIVTLDKDTPSFVYGKYAIGKTISRFGRSDCYTHTPTDLTVQNLI